MHYMNVTTETELISARLFLQLINQNQEPVNNSLMSDEAHFHSSGFVNKQNFHYWSPTNPTELHERPLHSSKSQHGA